MIIFFKVFKHQKIIHNNLMSIEYYLKLHPQHQQLRKIKRNNQQFLLARSQIKNNCFSEKNREIVIARYLETPDWALPYKYMSTIYNKKYKQFLYFQLSELLEY